MFTNPTSTAALAEQHRHGLLAQADADRLARAIRQGRLARARPPRPRGVLRVAGMAAATALITIVTGLVALRIGAPGATAFALAATVGHMGH